MQNTKQVRGSLAGFSGTAWGLKCETAEELMKNWELRQIQKNRMDLITYAKSNKITVLEICKTLRK